MTRLSGFVKDGGEGFHHEVKEERGQRVPLTHPSTISEEVPYFPVYSDRRLAPRDQTKRSVNPPWFKAFAEKNFPQEGPVHPVISLLKVQF
jgi:hypothetical protein